MNKGIIWVLSCLLVLSFSPSIQAQNEVNQGFDIAMAAKVADEGFHRMDVELKMEVLEYGRVKNEKSLSCQARELTAGGSRSMIFVENSTENQGRTTWVVTHENRANDHWQYDGDKKHSKAIKKADTPFMSSNFVYEDFNFMEVDKYTHRLLREEMNDEDHIYVVGRTPLEVSSSYSKQIVWYNASKGYRVEKVVFYDLNGHMLKTLRMKGYEKYHNKHWRPGQMLMINHQEDTKTLLTFESYRFEQMSVQNEWGQSSIARMGKPYN